MPLTATLEDAFGQDGFDLGDAVGSLSTLLSRTAPAAGGAGLDAGAIGQIAEQLSSADLGSLAAPVEAAIGQVAATAGDLPVVGDLLEPLTAALDAVELLTEGDTRNVLTRLEEAAAAAPGGVGLGGIAARLSALSEAREHPTVQGATALLSGLVPGLDLDAPVAALEANAPALAALARLLGGLMAVETLSRQIGETSGLVGGMLDPGAATAAARRVEAWRGIDLGAQLAGIDPDDEAAVLAALRPVGRLAADVKDAAAVLVRGLAFGEATLVDADLTALAARLDAASAGLVESALEPVRRGALALADRLEPVLAIELGPPAASLDAAIAELTGFVDELVTAIEGFDTGALTRPVSDGLAAALEPLRRLEALAQEAVAAVRSAFGTIREAIAAIDLRSVAETVQAALRPLVEALEAVERLIDDAQAAVRTAALAVTEAMTQVQTTLGTAAGTVEAAFGRVQEIVEELKLEELQRELEEGIQEVVTALGRAELRPYFDTGIEVMDTAADIVAAVPLDLLPDDTQQEVHEVVAPIKAIDFDAAVRDELVPRLRAILDALDEDVLAEIDEAYRAVVGFLEDIDPRGPLEQLERDAFDPMLERVRAVDPVALLEPVQSVLDELQGAIEDVDLRRDVLDPLDEAFDEVTGAVAAFDPAELARPIEERVDAARELVVSALGLDEWAARLDEVDGFTDRLLARLDFPTLVGLLEAVYDDVRPRPDRLPDGASAIGTFLAGLLEDTGLGLRMNAFPTVRRWLGGEDAAGEVRGRLEAAAAALDAVAATVRSVDLQALAAAAQPTYRGVVTAAEAHPAGSVLRRYADATLAGASPMDLLGGAVANQARYLAELDEAAALLRRLAGSGRSELTVIARGLREALGPLQAIPDRMMAVLARFGADVEGRTLSAVVAEVAEALRPQRVLAPLEPAVDALKAKVGALVHEGLVAPLRGAVGDVEGALAAVDLSFLRTELEDLHRELMEEIEALRPSVLLGELVTAAEQVLERAAGFDPLAPVRQVIDDMKAAIDAVVTRFRPTVLFAPILAAYDHILELAGGLDVRALLDPIIAALGDIEVQLEEGLQDAAAALTRLQEALP